MQFWIPDNGRRPYPEREWLKVQVEDHNAFVLLSQRLCRRKPIFLSVQVEVLFSIKISNKLKYFFKKFNVRLPPTPDLQIYYQSKLRRKRLYSSRGLDIQVACG